MEYARRQGAGRGESVREKGTEKKTVRSGNDGMGGKEEQTGPMVDEMKGAKGRGGGGGGEEEEEGGVEVREQRKEQRKRWPFPTIVLELFGCCDVCSSVWTPQLQDLGNVRKGRTWR
eukprot:761299-Hanusia_phi.AAC.2